MFVLPMRPWVRYDASLALGVVQGRAGGHQLCILSKPIRLWPSWASLSIVKELSQSNRGKCRLQQFGRGQRSRQVSWPGIRTGHRVVLRRPFELDRQGSKDEIGIKGGNYKRNSIAKFPVIEGLHAVQYCISPNDLTRASDPAVLVVFDTASFKSREVKVTTHFLSKCYVNL